MTRSNEVYRRWGSFLESKWIGHSRQVREDHYLTITDEDFQAASKWGVTTELNAQKPGTSSSVESVQGKISKKEFPCGIPCCKDQK